MSTLIQSNNLVNNTQTKKTSNQFHITNKFETYLKNSADMNDCVAVPRTIFKGYLGIMFGTMLAGFAGLLKKSKIKTGLNVIAAGLSAYGTWAFARPYVLKDTVPTVKPQINR